MTNSGIEESQIRYARLAGFIYLFVDVTYLAGVFIVTGLPTPGTFAETAQRINIPRGSFGPGNVCICAGADYLSPDYAS
jgi:hypothetical protein